MKRSQMKLKIEEAIKSCFQGPSVVPDKVLEAVLEACEEAGMKPPAECDCFHYSSESYVDHEWEPE